jgi:sortase (surface protein transpeptidase)
MPAVFDNLYRIQKGDKIYIEDNNGIIISFVVRGSQKYGSKADALNVFYSNDGKSHLNLITCTGIWDKIWKSRSDRLVVFTDKE